MAMRSGGREPGKGRLGDPKPFSGLEGLVSEQLIGELQSRPTPQRIRLSTTRTGGHQSAHRGRILTLDVDT